MCARTMLRRCLLPAVALAPAAPAATAQCFAETAKIANPTGSVTSGWGRQASLSGDTLAVAAWTGSGKGAVYVFERDLGGADAWGLAAKLVAPGGVPGELFARALAVDGDTIAVGAPDADVGGVQRAGAVHVFQRDQGGPGQWGHAAKLVASDPVFDGGLGSDVALSGDALAVGATGVEAGGIAQAGAVYVFERDLGGPGAFGEAQRIEPSAPVLAGWYGRQIALDGDTLAVGQSKSPSYLYVYDRAPGGAFAEVARLQPSHVASGAATELALSGGTLAAGFPTHGHGGVSTGAVFVFERDLGGANAWGEAAELLASDGAQGDGFGTGLAISGDTIAVGAPFDNLGGQNDRGAVYAFERHVGGANAWGEAQRLEEPTPGPFNQFGYAVVLDGDALAVTTLDNGPNAGEAWTFDAPPTVAYCTAGTSANGCSALVGAAGRASLSLADGFHVTVSGVEGEKQGLLYFGTSGAKATPWGAGSSWRCVRGPHTRTPSQISGGTAGQCDGAFFLDFNAWMAANPAKAPAPGDPTWMQAWFRDPPSPLTTSFSDALQFTVCP